jgi:hypothetical protein
MLSVAEGGYTTLVGNVQGIGEDSNDGDSDEEGGASSSDASSVAGSEANQCSADSDEGLDDCDD